jgi:hypothetical protein
VEVVAGVMVPFIGPERRLIGGETTGGRWSFTPSVFEAEMRGGKAGRSCLGGGNEEGRAPVRFDYSHMEESSRRWL